MPSNPWPDVPVTPESFRHPRREYGILPFWFLNGELDPDEMRFQLNEFRQKGMPGVILHARFGLEMPYLGEKYLERMRLAVAEAEKLGLQTWIYDEMNWPSGTADKQVLKGRPDLAQQYLECIHFTVRGPWFTCLTGGDSRYLDFERSTPVAAFAIGDGGQVIDLTPFLSFRDVIPWEAPAGTWRLMYIVAKTADYYIDALNPEATAEFLRLGYEPYARAIGASFPQQTLGFYTDEPAMHYYLTGGDNPIVPWTKDMFKRFLERNGYNLRPHLPDLFFDVSPEGARVRYDFYNTLTDFYSQAYYGQLHAWCRQHDILLTGHLLYEEWLRKLVRVEGNLFKHYPHLDVVGVDHLYPVVGSRDRPDDHVAIKVASSAAHQQGSPRLLCESYGGIFMDTTPQRMKWIADWEHALGVNLINPHGFHYTLEGPRKRDWPPSQFYQYPWWPYYGEFSAYISRLSQMLSGGRHVAKSALLWPLNSLFATYSPHLHNPLADRTEQDFNALTDLLLRLHCDFDYLDEDVLAGAELDGRTLRVGDEAYELVVLPPLTHLKLATLEVLEAFVQNGGRLLAGVFLPDQAFDRRNGRTCLVDVSARMEKLFGVDPRDTQRGFQQALALQRIVQEHPQGGRAIFLQTYAIARQLPERLQVQLGCPGRPEHPGFSFQEDRPGTRYFFTPESGERREITAEVNAERTALAGQVEQALSLLVEPDVTIDNREILALHRHKDGQELYFLANPTFRPQAARLGLPGEVQPELWDPATGQTHPAAPLQLSEGRTQFCVELPPAGSLFVLPRRPGAYRVTETNLVIDTLDEQSGTVGGYGRVGQASLALEKDGQSVHLAAPGPAPVEPLRLDGEWAFEPETDNGLVLDTWLATPEMPGTGWEAYALPGVSTPGWLPAGPGAWAYQLPAEPDRTYPIPVWYRMRFNVGDLPARLDLVVDGFAGQGWQLYVNGVPVKEKPERSRIDSQMQAVPLARYLQPGENLIAVRLEVAGPTDGILDLLKLVGDFALDADTAGGYRVVAPRRRLWPQSWTGQGYPYFSGRATYRRTVDLPAGFAGQRVFLEAEAHEDVLEVLVNGQSAGVCLWPPYRVELTSWLHPGANTLELRLANTLINLLEKTPRPSGLAGAPRLVPYTSFTFDLPR